LPGGGAREPAGASLGEQRSAVPTAGWKYLASLYDCKLLVRVAPPPANLTQLVASLPLIDG